MLELFVIQKYNISNGKHFEKHAVYGGKQAIDEKTYGERRFAI